MKNAIIVHGMPSKEEYFDPSKPSPSNNQWFPWLKEQLGLHGVAAHVPEMPDPYEPDYEKWKIPFQEFAINEETVLVGHSCGGGFLLRWLSEHPVTVAKVILVAPWIDPAKELGDHNTFFHFTINPQIASNKGITIFSSTNDDKSILATVAAIQAAIPGITLKEVENAGHFCIEDGYATFPAILEEVLAAYA